MVADQQREVCGQKNGSFQVLMFGAAIKGECAFFKFMIVRHVESVLTACSDCVFRGFFEACESSPRTSARPRGAVSVHIHTPPIQLGVSLLES